MRILSKFAAVALTGLGLAVAAPSAPAEAQYYGRPVYYYGPTYYAPRPRYYAPPVYYAPRVYYARPRYYGGAHWGHRHHGWRRW